MDDRLSRLEDSVNELRSDFKVMTQTLRSIDKTLSTLKELSDILTEIRINSAKHAEIINSLELHRGVLNRKIDTIESRINVIENSGVSNGIKIGAVERFGWFMVTVVVGFIVARVKGD